MDQRRADVSPKLGEKSHWPTRVSSSDVKPGDYIELRVYENYWLFRKMRIGMVRLQGDKLNRSSLEIKGKSRIEFSLGILSSQ